MNYKTMKFLWSKWFFISEPLKQIAAPHYRLMFKTTRCYCSSAHNSNLSCFDIIEVQKYLKFIESGSHLLKKINDFEEDKILEITNLLNNKKSIEMELQLLSQMPSEGDEDFEKLKNEEKCSYLAKISKIKEEILDNLFSFSDEYDNRGVELQIIPGIGGDEAKLFAKVLHNMYVSYSSYKNWDCSNVILKGEKFDPSCLSIYISGYHAYKHLRHEGGVHKVQRVPETEKSGRTHSSTCSVVVLPQPKFKEVKILPKDVIIDKMYASGPGGQNVNKTESCVRITHIPTGIAVECQESRIQDENKKIAFQKLAGKLYNMERNRVLGTLDSMKKKQMNLTEYSDRIRTYNYNQNRITDHRINYTQYDLKGFLEGNSALDELICKIMESSKTKTLLEHIYFIMESTEFKEFSCAKKI